MIITLPRTDPATVSDIANLIADVSTTNYDGNLEINRNAKALSGRRIQFRVVIRDSRAPGARRSTTGRRVAAACWHAYRDVLTELFDRYPAARVYTITFLAAYTSRDNFHAVFPDTAYKNVGSEMYPAYPSDLCDCGE